MYLWVLLRDTKDLCSMVMGGEKLLIGSLRCCNLGSDCWGSLNKWINGRLDMLVFCLTWEEIQHIERALVWALIKCWIWLCWKNKGQHSWCDVDIRLASWTLDYQCVGSSFFSAIGSFLFCNVFLTVVVSCAQDFEMIAVGSSTLSSCNMLSCFLTILNFTHLLEGLKKQHIFQSTH